MSSTLNEKRYKNGIIILSIVIPVVVAVLFGFKIPNATPLTFLPPIYAGINALTAVMLIAAVVAIKKGNRKAHERFNTLAIICSVLFLVMYVAYHLTSTSTLFGDVNADGVLSDMEAANVGTIRYVYYGILISHIILSIAVIPYVLFTYMKAKLARFEEHKKIAKITFPLWLYVAVTGVIVYFMIAPYYA